MTRKELQGYLRTVREVRGAEMVRVPLNAKNEVLQAEYERLCKVFNGVIDAEAVVSEARSEMAALDAEFKAVVASADETIKQSERDELVTLRAMVVELQSVVKEQGDRLSKLEEQLATGNQPVEDVPSADEVLEVIKELDYEVTGGENYLPIYHVRNRFNGVKREVLDGILYQLESEERLEIGSIVEAVGYTNEQLAAGIKQNVGGSLFFLMVA